VARRRRFQHGSIGKRGKRKKVWVARWREDVVGPDGALVRVRRTEILGTVAEVPTRRQAEQLLSDRLRHVNSGNHRPQWACTFRTFVQGQWEPGVFPSVKYSTRKHYEYAIRVHLLPTFGDSQLRLISRNAVQEFVAVKLRSGLAWKPVRHLRTVLGTILGAAESWGLIDRNPVRLTRFPRRPPQPERHSIAPEQIRQLLDCLPEPSRSVACLLVSTGLRIGELLALRWRDVDLDTRTLHVRQTVYEGHFDEPKTRRSNRTVPLGPKAVATLASRCAPTVSSETLVFGTRNGTPLSRRNLLHRQLVPTAAALGIHGINWHWWRHANATLLDAVGAPLGTVQALLGHSSSEITREVYLHAVPADARRAVEGVEELIGPKWTQVLETQKPGSRLIH